MKYSSILCLLLTAAPAVYASPVLPAPKLSSPQGITQAKHLRPVIEKRQQFAQGEPIDANGKGGPILGQYLTSHLSSLSKASAYHML
jgi:hypothetical protein